MDLNLRERTVVILGPLTNMIQNLMMGLTQNGADVVLIDYEGKKAEKFCAVITDQREANEKNGRALALTADLGNEISLKDALGKAAQSFGSIDILIDAQLMLTPSPVALDKTDNIQSVITELSVKNIGSTLMATQYVVPFLKGRKRGRILYLINDSQLGNSSLDALSAAFRSGLVAFAKALRPQLQEFNICVNVISVGVTEEYLLGHFPECNTIKEALEKFKQLNPSARITEPDKVSQSVLFLISSAGAAISGQLIQLQ